MLETSPINLFIPMPGARLRLEAPWSFDLHADSRNQALWRALGFPNPYLAEPFRWESTIDTVHEVVTMPAGVILIVERIFVRRGEEDVASVCFRIDAESPIPQGRKKRFGTSVSDCNRIVCTVLEPAPREEYC